MTDLLFGGSVSRSIDCRVHRFAWRDVVIKIHTRGDGTTNANDNDVIHVTPCGRDGQRSGMGGTGSGTVSVRLFVVGRLIS